MERWVQFDFHLPVATVRELVAWAGAVDFLLREIKSLEGWATDLGSSAETTPLVRRYGWAEWPGGFIRKLESICTVTLPGTLKDPDLMARAEKMMEQVAQIYATKAGVSKNEMLYTAREVYALRLPPKS